MVGEGGGGRRLRPLVTVRERNVANPLPQTGAMLEARGRAYGVLEKIKCKSVPLAWMACFRYFKKWLIRVLIACRSKKDLERMGVMYNYKAGLATEEE